MNSEFETVFALLVFLLHGRAHESMSTLFSAASVPFGTLIDR